MKILDFCRQERPRERLTSSGVAALSNAELLALILRTGYLETNALDMGRMLLKESDGSLVTMSGFSMDRLMALEGIGPGKASSILAAFELGKRCCSEPSEISKVSLKSPYMVFSIMNPSMKGLSHEELWALFLNNANYLTGKLLLCSGGISAVSVDVRKLVVSAMEKKATSVILVHNHPSGNPRPGKEDISCTDMMRQALKTFDIALLDHVIISDDSFYSFSEGLSDRRRISP